jgi:hypothetical protein
MTRRRLTARLKVALSASVNEDRKPTCPVREILRWATHTIPSDPSGKSLLIRGSLSSPSRKNKSLIISVKQKYGSRHPASMQRALWPIITEREAGMRWTL